MKLDRPFPKRLLFWLSWHIVLLCVWCGLFAPACIEALSSHATEDFPEAVPDHTERHAAFVREHLAGPYDGYSARQVFSPDFDIIALSHMAYGVMNLATANPGRAAEYAPMIRAIVTRALDARTSPMYARPDEVDGFGDYNLYASHLNLILGVFRHITGETTHDDLHTRLSRHLALQSNMRSKWHARSYPVPKHLSKRPHAYKWPADQSVLLASLYLYDRTRKATLSRRPIRGWLRFMASDRMRHEPTGLPLSSVDSKTGYAKYPRGCALSWTILYMTQFAPQEAAELYATYREQFSESLLGWGGFREWPPGIDRGMDVDSGPIIGGVGMAATGLGVAPARIMRDAKQYDLIMRSAATFGLPSKLAPTRSYLTSPLLGEAILFSGTTARRWFGDAPKTKPMTGEAPAPTGVWILLLVLGALIYYALASIRETIAEIRSWR